MKKNTKIAVVTTLSIIVVTLIFLLIYSNLYIKSNNIEINKNYTFENLTISDFAYTTYKDKHKTVLNFKITNNTKESLYGCYIRVYLKNDKNEVVYSELISIPIIDARKTRDVSFEVDKKIAEIHDFEFKKVIVEGAG